MKSADVDGGLATDAAEEADHAWASDAVRRAQEGDPAAFDELVLAYQDRIYNLINRMVGDADEAYDLLQDTFVKAYRALASFRRDARFSTWIYRIAVNACLSRHRKQAVRKRHAPVSLDQGYRTADGGEVRPDPPDVSREPARETTRRETQVLVRQAIDALDDDYRLVVLLRDMEGYSYEEIQEILGCPIGTVRSRLHRARAELGRKLKRAMGE